VGMEQPRNLHGYFLTPFRRSGDQRRSATSWDIATLLRRASEFAQRFCLPFIVLVEQQMQLVGWTNGFALFRLRLHQSNLLSSGLPSPSRAADRVALLHT
jgi:hypothetical protein